MRYAIADWVDAQDSALAWISGKVPSKCTPNFITVALPFLEIFRKSRYFLNRPCTLDLRIMDIIFISIGGGNFSHDMVHSESIATKIGEIKKCIAGAITFSKLHP